MEIWKSVIAFICGAGGLALIEWARAAWKHKTDRKDLKEDRQEAKVDKLDKLTSLVEDMAQHQKDSDAQIDALQEAMKCVLLDRVIFLGQKYIASGEIDFDDRRRLREMHHAYHVGLGGNGDADAIMKAVDELPLKNI